ncbi:hypothetical protein K431DRAFT_282310 [Polychaeton citri CBS 116435]|uniref:arginyltransferase n=1 Tax=Polychaeton citri CBS 116435 TaxID=1314669 RepID=A0A9P4QG16_9PEZI|nr:hypothetical protein K431DRAFT_282310 [Polychaeton citri CBS 116435]
MQDSSATSGALSLFSPIGYQTGDCGYCKGEDTSQRTPKSRASYYGRSKSLSPEHYQQLMDRGWRRSGSLLYLPDASRSCCPHYTIRIPVAEFKPSRDQRQALNRWNRYVLGEDYPRKLLAKHPKSKEAKKLSRSTFDLTTAVHESELSYVKPDIAPSHRLEVTLEDDTFTDEKYALFQDYQQHVHHEGPDEITKAGFRRFLCESPLHRQTTESGMKLGSYHQCYRLDGRLVAMGVLDLVPHGISGVYFIYHRDFERWSFGKLSALREATLALEGGHQNYYMGYYIHGCAKMRYKGDYKFQYVLDFDSLEWSVLDDNMRSLMDRRKYVSMSKERQKQLETEAIETKPNAAQAENTVQYDLQYYDQINYPTPLDAVASGMSLLSLGMPSVTPVTELLEKVDIDTIRIHFGHDRVHFAQDLITWDTGSIFDAQTPKGIFAEYSACVGPQLANELIVDLSRP